MPIFLFGWDAPLPFGDAILDAGYAARDQQAALDAGARFFLSKPYEGTHLVEAVDAAVSETRTARPVPKPAATPSIETTYDVTVIAVPAEASATRTSRRAWREIERTTRAHSKIVLDMSCIESLDRTALSAFLSCLSKIAKREGIARICGAPKTLRLLLELVRIHEVVGIFDTPDAATKSWRRAHRINKPHLKQLS